MISSANKKKPKNAYLSNIFTQAIDQLYYCKEKDASIDYYSYDGCDIKEINRLVLSKSQPNESEEDKSTVFMFSDEEINNKENFDSNISNKLFYVTSKIAKNENINNKSNNYKPNYKIKENMSSNSKTSNNFVEINNSNLSTNSCNNEYKELYSISCNESTNASTVNNKRSFFYDSTNISNLKNVYNNNSNNNDNKDICNIPYRNSFDDYKNSKKTETILLRFTNNLSNNWYKNLSILKSQNNCFFKIDKSNSKLDNSNTIIESNSNYSDTNLYQGRKLTYDYTLSFNIES